MTPQTTYSPYAEAGIPLGEMKRGATARVIENPNCWSAGDLIFRDYSHGHFHNLSDGGGFITDTNSYCAIGIKVRLLGHGESVTLTY